MLGAVMYFMLWLPLNILRRTVWRWRVEGVENLPPRPQGVIIAANHLNWTDIPILGASTPLSHRGWWMGKIELLSGPLLTWWFRQMQVIPIKRGKRDLTALTACEDVLRAGGVLMIFPEGHRSSTGQLQEARGGTVRLATRTGCPIVPVAIWGTEKGMRRTLLRNEIRVVFGKPYHPQAEGEHIAYERMAELNNELMLHIAELMPERYWGAYRERLADARQS
jgi:1-acyl-sn-glycerol-3-phosphate acyltransferase